MRAGAMYTRSLATISELVFPLNTHLNLLEEGKKEAVACLLDVQALTKFFQDFISGNTQEWPVLHDRSLYPNCNYNCHLHDALPLRSQARQSSRFTDFIELAKSHLNPASAFYNVIEKFRILVWLFDPEFTNHFMILLYLVDAGLVNEEWTSLLQHVATPPAVFHFRKAGLEAHCMNPCHNSQTWRGLFQTLGYRPNFYKKKDSDYYGLKPNAMWRRVNNEQLRLTGRYKDLQSPVTVDSDTIDKHIDAPRIRQNTPLWLKMREGSIGGSSCGNILGLAEKSSCRFLEAEFKKLGINYRLNGDHKRMIQEWNRLTNNQAEEQHDPWQQFCFQWGHEHENNGKLLWLNIYQSQILEETGMHFLQLEQIPSGAQLPSFPIHASPDGLIEDAVIEIKSRVPFYNSGNEYHYNGHKIYPHSIVIPIHYAQLQFEMLCAGKNLAHLVIVSASNGATMFTVEKNVEWLTLALKWLIRWHEKFISGPSTQVMPVRDNMVYHIPSSTVMKKAIESNTLDSKTKDYLIFLELTARECARATSTKVHIDNVPYTEAEHQPMFLDNIEKKKENSNTESNEDRNSELYVSSFQCLKLTLIRLIL